MTKDYMDASQAIDARRGIDYIGVTTPFYCYDNKGRILLHRRGSKCRDEVGRWDCGGGSMEFGESFEEAVTREIGEEYGAAPKQLKLCGVTNVVRDNNGVKTHWIAVIFAAEVSPSAVRIMEPDKVDELGWFYSDNLPTPLHSMLAPHLEIVRRAGVKI
ncbi:MAG: NUDIX domain-containing protein [bacterium]